MPLNSAMRSGGAPEPSKAGLFLSSGQKAQGQILEAEPLGFMRTEKEDREGSEPEAGEACGQEEQQLAG